MAQRASGVEAPGWYCIRLTREDCEGGELAVLQGAFRDCYIAGNGPRGMAMLGEFEVGGQGAYRVYLTPASIPHVRPLVRAYSAKPDAPPRRRGLKVLYGDPDGAWLTAQEF
jgi:hypothetical protein